MSSNRYVRLYSGADPVIDEEDQFKVTVPLDADHVPEGGATTRKTSSQTGIQTEIQTEIQTNGLIDDLDKDILRLLTSDATLTTETIAGQLNRARITIAKHVRKLKSAGLLVREGGRARGVWKVLRLQPQAESSIMEPLSER